MGRSVLTLILWMTVIAGAVACAWDYDTLAIEAKGKFNEVHAITGRFDRYPPLYYEMRLARVKKLIAKNPSDWEAYDAAAVASDKLGKFDEAVEWMEKKERQLKDGGVSPTSNRDAWYRYHANIGTIYAHRWFATGANKKQDIDLITAEGHIARAIEINPDAHFGREIVQLEVLRWLIASNAADRKGEDHETLTSHLTGEAEIDLEKNIKGLIGIIIMGSGWNSVDVFSTLGDLLEWRGDSYLAFLAKSRAVELWAGGSFSMGAGLTHKDANLKESIDIDPEELMIEDESDKARVRSQYAALRQNANQWHYFRTAFMEDQLKKGRHPDTHNDFWKGYQEVPAIHLTDFGDSDGEDEWMAWAGGVGGIGAIGAIAGYATLRLRRRRAAFPPPAG